MEIFNSQKPKTYSDDYIATIANKVRESLKLERPYSPEEVVKKLCGEINETINEEYVDAYIKKSGETSFIIQLNADRAKTRKSFTIAHELGHLFLHMGFLIDDEKWNAINEDYQDSAFYRMSGHNIPGFYAQEEHEANVFAANFLMPKDEFIRVANDNLDGNRYNLSPIAEYFDVSEPAVANRGKWLGIFKW